MFLTGATDTGKSTLARRLVLSTPAPRVLIDPYASEVLAVDGEVLFRDPNGPPAGFATARFVPRDPEDLDAYDRLYRWVLHDAPKPIYVHCDEQGVVMPSNNTPRNCRIAMLAGRKLGIGHSGCHTRPVEVNRNAVAMAKHVFIFDTPHPDDRRFLAGTCGIPPALLDQLLAELADHGFLHWAQRGRTLTVCPPLEVGRG